MKLLPPIVFARSLSIVTLVSFVLGALPFWGEALAREGAVPVAQPMEDHTLDSLWNQNVDDPTPQIRPKPAASGVEKSVEQAQPKPVQAKTVQPKAQPEKPTKHLPQKVTPPVAVKPSVQSPEKQVEPKKGSGLPQENTSHKAPQLKKSSKKLASPAPETAVKTEKTVLSKKSEKTNTEIVAQPAPLEPASKKAKSPAAKRDSKRKKDQWAPMVETNLTPLTIPAAPVELKLPEKPSASSQPTAEPKENQLPKAEKKSKRKRTAPLEANQAPQLVQPVTKPAVSPEVKPAQPEKPAKLKKEKSKKEKKKKAEKPKHKQPAALTEKPTARKSDSETKSPETSLLTQPLQSVQPEKSATKPPKKVKIEKAHVEKPRPEKPKREKPKREKSPKAKRPQTGPAATEKLNVSPVGAQPIDKQGDTKPVGTAPLSVETSRPAVAQKETINQNPRDKAKKSRKRASKEAKPVQTAPEAVFPPSASSVSPVTKALEEQASPNAGTEKQEQARKPKAKKRKNKAKKAKAPQTPKNKQDASAKPSAEFKKPENALIQEKQGNAAAPSSQTPDPLAPSVALPAPESKPLEIQNASPVAEPEAGHTVESLPEKQTPVVQPTTTKASNPKETKKHVKPTKENPRKKTSTKNQTDLKPVLLPQILPSGLKALPTPLQTPADSHESSAPVASDASTGVEKPSNQVIDEAPKAESKLAPQPASQAPSQVVKPEPVQVDPSVELFPDAVAQPASKPATSISEPASAENPASNIALLREQAQDKVKSYATALNQWRQSSHPENLEPILNKGQEAAHALLKVAEDLEDGEFRDIALQMQGYLMIRDEVLVITPDPTFFLALAKQKGKPVDVAFFELMGQTVNGYWPTTMEQMDDLSGCSRFGTGELVRLYGEWKSFQKLHPTVYQKALQDPNLLLLSDIEDQLSHSTSACDGPDAVVSELQKFIAFYPKSPLTAVLQKRLNALKQNQSDFTFNQGIKHRVSNPESP